MATGHLEKRYKSSWTIVIDAGRDHEGERIRIVKSIKTTRRKDAEKEMRKMLYEIENGTYVESNKLTVGEYLKQWLKGYAKSRVAAKTYQRYKQLVDSRITPELGHIQLEQLKPLHLQEFYTELAFTPRLDAKEGFLAQNTILYHHRVIHKALNTALKWQLVVRNVADAVEAPRQEHKEIKILDTDEVKAMLEAAKNTKYHSLVTVAVLTGMRRGELLGLRWNDVDFEANKIYVQQSLQYTKETGTTSKNTKTAGSRRAVAMAPEVITALETQKLTQEAQKQKCEEKGKTYQDNDLVFCQKNGQPMHPDTPSSWFPKFLTENNLPRIEFKALRHTCASLLLKMGIRSKVVAEMLGHTTTKITDDIYSHVLPGIQEDAVEKLSNSIFRQLNGNEMATAPENEATHEK